MNKIKIDGERCKSCGLCAEACPKKIIKISAEKMNSYGYRPAELTDEALCIGCGFCATVCPDCVITLGDGKDK